MSTFGLTDSGFIKKTQKDIEKSLELYFQSNFSPSFKVSSEADTANDQLLITVANELAEVWENLEAEYYAFVKSFASGIQLDNIGEYFNLPRLAGVKTVVEYTVEGDAGTVIPANSIISVQNTNIKFENLTDITIPTSGAIDADFTCIEYGPITVISNTLTVIETPITGWDSVINSNVQKTIGRFEETDAEYRVRMDLLRYLNAKGTREAIKSAIAEVDNIIDVKVYENRENVTDGQGRPSKSFECIVYGGTNQDIANAIWSVQPAGIENYGTVTQTLYDSEGVLQTVKFTRPTEVNIYIDIHITTDNTYPIDGDNQIKTVLANHISKFKIGQGIILTKLYGITYGITGVTNAVITIGTTSTTSSDDITIDYNQIATINTDNISIT